MESGTNKRPKILLVSSVDPYTRSGKLGIDYYNAFKAYGYEIDFLTKTQSSLNKDFLFVTKESSPNLFAILKQKIKYSLKTILGNQFIYYTRRIFKKNNKDQSSKYEFFYKNEQHPPIAPRLVTQLIKKSYDLVIIVFWQGLLSAETVSQIFNKSPAAFFLIAVDFSPITGGCHYFWECDGYKDSCGSCPAWNSTNPNDFTHKNILYKNQVYNKVNPVIFGNSFMNNIFKQSHLFKYRTVERLFPIVNEAEFFPKDRLLLRRKYNIPSHKKFIAFFGAQHIDDERKGMPFLIEALNFFANTLSTEQKEEILLIIAGNHSRFREIQLPFECKPLGFLDFTILPDVFSLADVFLSPSILDAGPMMINQSLSCGTPVISFDIGVAIDVIKNGVTGYKAILKDAKDFANGLNTFYMLSESDKLKISIRCRETAMKTTSYEASVKKIIQTYYSLEQNG